MKRKDYNVLIERLKSYAQEDPAGYKKRVIFLGLLGYAYILLVILFLVGLIVGSIWIMIHARGSSGALAKLVIFFFIVIFVILKSLWIKIEAPTGWKLTKETAPKLFAVIEDICRQQQSILPHTVLLDSNFNAFISQVPRLGILGSYKNYLVLGLPYMLSCGTQHFKAVIAHEFGHFAGAHGRMSTWIYRIRSSWYNIMENFQRKQSFGDIFFQWFFNWYVPYFNAYSFVLGRANEYEADRYANTYAGAEANAEELVNMIIKTSATGPYWEAVWKRVNDEPTPPKSIYTDTRDLIKQTVPPEKYQTALTKALRMRTQNLDTHPGLKDRLAALGYRIVNDTIVDGSGKPLVLQRAVELSAAEDLLGERIVAEGLKRFDAEWVRNIEPEWKRRHEEMQKTKKDLAALNTKAETSPLSEAELADRAFFIDQLGNKDETIAAIGAILAVNPEHAPANFRLGQLLLEKSDEKGLEHLKKAMAVDASYSSACLEWIGWHHENKGEYDRVEVARDQYDKTAEKDQADYVERNTLTAKDALKEHGLEAGAIMELKAQFYAFAKEIKEVYLVQKVLKVYPQEPMYVIGVKGNMGAFQLDPQAFNQKLLDKVLKSITLKVSRGTMYFVVGDEGLIKRFKKVPNSMVCMFIGGNSGK